MKKILLISLLLTSFLSYYSFAQESRIFRYSNASETEITFIHAGDLFVVPISGGLARRLTTTEGLEMYPRFSPDGKTIAFSSEYDGNREIYTISNEGGEAKRITYSMDIQGLPERMGPDKIIMQWTDNDKILYRSREISWHAWSGNLFESNINGGLPEMVPVDVAGYAYMSPDGKKMAYNKIFREYRTWKRYRGGQADEIRIYDFATQNMENISNSPSQDIIPLWAGDKIYYQSDRTGTMNIYVYDLISKATKAVTNYTEYDVKFASLGKNHISFENGGYIYLLDLKTDNVKKVSIEIKEDFPDLRSDFVNVSKKIRAGSIAPDGSRVALVARGNIYTVPEKKGKIHQLTETSGVHERNVVWSPKGDYLAYISDETGKDEIFLMRPDGSGKTQLTDDNQSYRFGMTWSPDGTKILSSDKSMRLYYIDINTKKTIVIAKSGAWELRDFSWSPDSKWIVFSDYVGNYIPVINIYNLESKKVKQVTNEFFQSYNGIFSEDGKYLYFISNRTFAASLGQFEWNFQYKTMSKLYGLTLSKDMDSPFKYESDEYEWSATEGEDDEKDKKKSKKNNKKNEVDVKIDFEGLGDRIFEFPVETANYGSLYSKGNSLYYSKSTVKKGRKLYKYDLSKKEESEIGDFANYDISANQKKILIVKGKKWYVENFGAKIKPKNALKTSGLKTYLNRSEEWKQVFNEGWRQMKDFFYDPNMHGVDWDKMKKRYELFLPYVHHKADLVYIMSEMISELNIGHAYVGGGEMPKVKKVGIGLLGVEYKFESGSYKLTNIFDGRNWEEKTRSPLTEPGINVKEGEYLVAIEGKELTKNYTPYIALNNKVREYVTISVNSKATMTGAREYTVKTIGSEAKLRYYNWVEEMRSRVDKATNGRVGYVHIPDMGVGNGLNEFAKYFYPQAAKEALIIDDRYNGGGNVSPMIIERLKRKVQLQGRLRNSTNTTFKPNATMKGPMVLLINELSASDGDLFPYQFKQENLGTIIGKRSWGGVIGIRGSLPFLDGSYMMKPEFGAFSKDGEWILEGYGQDPDIEVENQPGRILSGTDDQLNKAIEEILKDLKNKKDKLKVPSKYPIRTSPRN